MIGVIWAVYWYAWFRDSPSAKPGVSQSELAELSGVSVTPAHGFPWRSAMKSETLIATAGTAFCYVYVYTFYQTWFHTFLVKGRGFSEESLLLSALPYTVAACANVIGGITSDVMVRRLGTKWGRRSLGVVGLASTCLFAIAVMFTRDQVLTVLLSLVYATITFQQSGVFGVCLDIGKNHAGSIIG